MISLHCSNHIERVLNTSGILPEGYSMRLAEMEDCRQIWKMANLPEVRAASFSTSLIPFKTHAEWFRKKLADDNTLFLVLINSYNVLAGQIRFELKNSEWLVSVSLKKDFCGKGLGSAMIKNASNALFSLREDVNEISAYIKKDNLASINSFKNAGYRYVSDVSINSPNDALLMVKQI